MADQNGFHREAVRSAQIRWVDKMLVTIVRQICRASFPEYSDDDGVAIPFTGVDFASRAIFCWHNLLLDLDSQHQTIRPLLRDSVPGRGASWDRSSWFLPSGSSLPTQTYPEITVATSPPSYTTSRDTIRAGIAREGDLIAVTAGVPFGTVGSTNVVHVTRVGDKPERFT